MNERLLTVPEAAERLAVASGSIRKWLYLRRINAVHIGRAVRIKESELKAIIESGLREGKGQNEKR